jgi:hypothetical protein
MAFLKRATIISVLMLSVWHTQASAQAPEYQVKAAMLYKFTLFVEWPAEAFATEASPFIVCVLGIDPFGLWLQQEMGETRVGTHPVEIHHPVDAEAVPPCHMIFVSRSERSRIKRVLKPLRKKNALIVSDVSGIDQFLDQGGMIGLVMEGSKVRFVLNSEAMERAGLKADSRLKRIAKSVK